MNNVFFNRFNICFEVPGERSNAAGGSNYPGFGANALSYGFYSYGAQFLTSTGYGLLQANPYLNVEWYNYANSKGALFRPQYADALTAASQATNNRLSLVSNTSALTFQPGMSNYRKGLLGDATTARELQKHGYATFQQVVTTGTRNSNGFYSSGARITDVVGYKGEPPRVLRRPFHLSHAASFCSLSMA